MARLPVLLVLALGLALAGGGQWGGPGDDRAYAAAARPGAVRIGGSSGGRLLWLSWKEGRFAARVGGPGAVRALDAAGDYWAGEAAGQAALGRWGEPPLWRLGAAVRSRAVGIWTEGARAWVAGTLEGPRPDPLLGGSDLFLAEVDLKSGATLALHRFGTGDDDHATAFVHDREGGFWLAGYLEVNEDCIRVSERAFLYRLDPAGRVRARHLFGFAASSRARALLPLPGGAVLAGSTDGALFGPAAGGDDLFLVRFDTRARPLAQVQFGTPLSDLPRALARGRKGLWLAGASAGGLAGANRGGFDAFWLRVGEGGKPVPGGALGTPGDDAITALAAGSQGVFAVGETEGALFGPAAGGRDVFLFRLAPGGE